MSLFNAFLIKMSIFEHTVTVSAFKGVYLLSSAYMKTTFLNFAIKMAESPVFTVAAMVMQS